MEDPRPATLETLADDRLRGLPGIKWRSYGEDVLPLWVADMDFPAAEPIRRHLRRVVDDAVFGYPVDAREQGLPEAFAEHCAARYGWRPDPDRVEVLTDVVQGLYAALDTLTERGQGVVVQPPVYHPFLHAVADTARRRVDNPLVPAPVGFEMDLDGLESIIDAETRVLMLCNPQNPTGRVFTRRELERLAEVVLRHDLIVLSDEIHADLVYPGARHVPFASLSPEVEARTVTFNSATKAFNIAGLRCAVAAFGSEALQQRFLVQPRKLLGGLDCFAAAATRIAWTECGPWLASLMQHLQANRAFLADFLTTRLPQVAYCPPEATYLAWLDCRGLPLGGVSPFEFFLEHARVAGLDGARFGPGGEGWLRLNFATSREVLETALERMVVAVERS